MEQKRSFIIILTVTIVLTSFFGAAMWLFYPYQKSDQILATNDISKYFRGNIVNQTNENEEIVPENGDLLIEKENNRIISGDLEIVYGILDDAHFIDDPLGRRLSSSNESSGSAEISSLSSSQVAIQVETRTPAKELGSSGNEIEKNESQGVTSNQSSPRSSSMDSETNVSRQQNAQSTFRSTQQGATQQGATQQADPVSIEEFWIQVISSPSRDRVEQVQDVLQSFGLGGRITTININNETYFRLRYGPYSHRPEAQKFLDWLKDMPQFTESFISVEYRMIAQKN